jgi:hypothetical protein
MVVYAAQHNGGRTQTNLNYSNLGDHCLINRLAEGQVMQGVTSLTSAFDPNDYNFDANGYPRAIVDGGIRILFTCETAYDRPGGVMKLDWLGAGTVKVFTGTPIAASGTITSGAVTSTTAGGWITFTPPANGRPEVGITGIGSASDYPNRLRAYFVDDDFGTDETDINAGYITSSPFRRQFAAAKFGRLRFLNWGGLSDLISCPETTWALRRPKDYIFQTGAMPLAGLWAGSTTNSGDDYSITPPGTYQFGGGAPTHRQVALVKWSATAAGNVPTLAWAGGAAKLVRSARNVTVDLTGLNTGRPSNGNVHCLTFDAFLDCWINHGSLNGNMYYNAACSPELMIDIAAELGAHLDYPIPWLAAEEGWTAGLAAACAAHPVAAKNGGWMVPLFEGPNEMWNNSVGYSSKFAIARASLFNGCTWSNGAITVPGPYSVTAVSDVTVGSNVNGQARLVIGAHAFEVGASVSIVGNGSSGLTGAGFNTSPQACIVKAADATSITLAWGPSGGTYAGSGLTVTAIGISNSSDTNPYYGYLMNIIGQEAATAFGVAMADVKTQTWYRCGCGVQTSVTPTNQNERMFNSYGVLQSGDSNQAPHNWITSLRPANYWGLGYIGTATETSLIAQLNPSAITGYVSAANQFTATSTSGMLTDSGGNRVAVGKYLFGINFNETPPQVTAWDGTVATFDGPAQTVETSDQARVFLLYDDITAVHDYLDSYNTGAGSSARYDVVHSTYYPNWVAYAKKTGVTFPPYMTQWVVKYVDCYEGGYSNDYSASASPAASSSSAIRFHAKRIWTTATLPLGMLGLVYGDLKALTDLSDASVTVEFPSQYQFCARWPTNQIWPALYSITETNLPPELKAHNLFNNRLKRHSLTATP